VLVLCVCVLLCLFGGWVGVSFVVLVVVGCCVLVGCGVCLALCLGSVVIGVVGAALFVRLLLLFGWLVVVCWCPCCCVCGSVGSTLCGSDVRCLHNVCVFVVVVICLYMSMGMCMLCEFLVVVNV
jgi:hypothetical protein